MNEDPRDALGGIASLHANTCIDRLTEAGWVVVFRTDLEAACEFADVEHWNMAPGQRRVFDRLRAVLNTENQT